MNLIPVHARLFSCLGRVTRKAFLRLALMALLSPGPALAHLDLASARVESLKNGLTVIVLEEHSFPVVSVQMLYRVGARNEQAGATGLAHFLEHMAFRDAENFPGTDLVSSIYAAGGEWHGYTWLDQTTYFATAPKDQLDLLLRIEADRMSRLEIEAADVSAERGAVLTEMHGYENDPTSVLHDQVLYLSFLAHPYRNNTIGWDSDVSHISHAELVDFYQSHYHPGNAVLAVVGDIESEDVLAAVQQHFAALPGRSPTPPPHTVEPPQNGERRIRLQGELDRKYFEIAWHAPAANNPDYAAFLLLQELLAASSGVSFLQNDWGTKARPGSALDGISDDLTTWFPPSAQDYVFTVAGSVAPDVAEPGIEEAVEAAINRLDSSLAEQDGAGEILLERARQQVLRELVFDVQTTEDAAHQLAFFAGLDALDALLELPRALAGVSPADIERVLRHYLRSDQRSIGWYVPYSAELPSKTELQAVPESTAAQPDNGNQVEHRSVAVSQERAAPATIARLSNGTPVIIQRSPLSASLQLKVVASARTFPDSSGPLDNDPIWGLSSLDFALLPGELGSAIDQARAALLSGPPPQAPAARDSSDPATRLEQVFEGILGLKPPAGTSHKAPLLLLVCGDMDPAGVLQQLEGGFGDLPPASRQEPPALSRPENVVSRSHLAHPAAQEQLGYLVQAPGPGQLAVPAWQMALYILSHGYEGRLGRAAITQRGLIYYIDSAYRTDGRNGWITLSMGVDPGKLQAMQDLLKSELARLLLDPPSEEEVDEARRHLLGRYVSAAQSNHELTNSLAQQWFWYGVLPDYRELEKRLDQVRQQDIIALLPDFTGGSVVAVTGPGAE